MLRAIFINPQNPVVSSFSINVSDGMCSWAVGVDGLGPHRKCHPHWTIECPSSKIIGPLTSLLSIINLLTPSLPASSTNPQTAMMWEKPPTLAPWLSPCRHRQKMGKAFGSNKRNGCCFVPVNMSHVWGDFSAPYFWWRSYSKIHFYPYPFIVWHIL